MADIHERVCIGCGDNEEQARLEVCSICRRTFCPDCVYRAVGRRFCSSTCAHTHFYGGDSDDNEDLDSDE